MSTFQPSRLERIQALLAERHEPGYRYEQICRALFVQHVRGFHHITSVPPPLRLALEARLGEVLALRPVAHSQAAQAIKVLFELHDGRRIEAVHMRYRAGHTALCISSQAGCALACAFCATGAVGFYRHLSADEIADQVLYFLQRGHRPKSVSFMGMGEPLANPHTFDALRLLADARLFGLSARRLSVSTVGVVPGIERLTREFPQVNLAFSLHSPFDDERSRLVPLNRRHPIEEIFGALDRHVAVTHRKVFVAYLLLQGVNDSLQHAGALAELLKGRGAASDYYHVNLLRYNPAQGAPGTFRRTPPETMRNFVRVLRSAGVNVTARQSFGVDIDAACGQLHAEYYRKL